MVFGKSLDDRGVVGYFFNIDLWQSGTARVMQDGIVVKGLAPKPLDPVRYLVNPRTDLSKLDQGMRGEPSRMSLASSDGWIMKAEHIKARYMPSNQMLPREQRSLPV